MKSIYSQSEYVEKTISKHFLLLSAKLHSSGIPRCVWGRQGRSRVDCTPVGAVSPAFRQ